MCDQIVETNLSVFAFDVIAISGFWKRHNKNTHFSNNNNHSRKKQEKKIARKNCMRFLRLLSLFGFVSFSWYGPVAVCQYDDDMHELGIGRNAAEKNKTLNLRAHTAHTHTHPWKRAYVSMQKPDKVIWHVLKSTAHRTEIDRPTTTFSFGNFILTPSVVCSFFFICCIRDIFSFYSFWLERKLKRIRSD